MWIERRSKYNNLKIDYKIIREYHYFFKKKPILKPIINYL